MKKSRYIYALFLSVAFSLTACTDELEYQAGEPDLEDCLGVYFPAQEAQKDHEFEPSDKGYEIEIKVKRLKGDDAITVPYSTDGIDAMFTASEIKFEAGQMETTLKLSLPADVPFGTTFNCEISIDDPRYALKYRNDYKTSIYCSAIVLKWNRLTGQNGEQYGIWRDDFITSIMRWDTYDNEEVIIEERDDKPGYFRITGAYSPEYAKRILKPYADDYKWDESIYEQKLCARPRKIVIDATTPNKVFIPAQRLGLDLTAVGASDLAFLSIHNRNLPSLDASGNIYGTYDKETGTITFPKDGLLMTLLDDVVYVNTRGYFRVMLPGFKPIDYTVHFDAGLMENGKVDIGYVLGSDVSHCKYGIYEGRLTEAQMKAKARELVDGTAAADGVLTEKEGVISVSDRSRTGYYTLVSANYTSNLEDAKDPSGYIEYSSVRFTYAAGDEMDVQMRNDLVATNRYSDKGYTSENSLELFISGEDIEEAYFIVRQGDYTNVDDKEIIDNYFTPAIEDYTLTAVSDSALLAINGDGYLTVEGELASGAEYTLMVYASNGYKRQLIKTVGRTSGKYDVTTDKFTYDKDISKTQIYPVPVMDLAGVYDYYAYDYLKKSKTREKVGRVSIVSHMGIVQITGLMGPAAEPILAEVELTSDMVSYPHTANNLTDKGYIQVKSYPYYKTGDDGSQSYYEYMLDGKIPMPLVPGFIETYYTGTRSIVMGAKGLNDVMMVAGVAQGQNGDIVIAFDDADEWEQKMGYTYNGFSFAAFDLYFTRALKVFSAYDKPILVPDEKTAEILRASIPSDVVLP